MSSILYSFRRCPYAMRARMALMYSQINIEHREILLKDKPVSMLQYSVKGTVPVLVVADKVIDESLDVMYWALNQNDPENWLLNGDDLQQEMLKLIHISDTEFKPLLDKYKYSDRYELNEEQYREDAEWFLSMLEQKLRDHDQLINNYISLADVAVFPFVRQFAFVNKQWFDNNKYTSLQNWLDRHLKSTLFQSIMQKHVLWRDN